MIPGRIAQDAKAMRTLAEWLGEGGLPVMREQAALRAKTCMECPHNWTQRVSLEMSVAKVIRDSNKVRSAIGAELDDESRIGTCGICGCYLPLKIWVPLKHLAPKPGEFPDHCWATKEAHP